MTTSTPPPVIEDAIASTLLPLTPRRKYLYITLMVLATIVWGSTFLVVQETIKLTGVFTFLALRFSLGALTLILIFHKRLRHMNRYELGAGSCIGLFLFAGFALQTWGLRYTTSSEAAFITGLYVPFVTILSLFILKQKPTRMAITGVVISFVGLTLISFNKNLVLTFGLGELLVLGCAVANALHIVTISKFAPKADPMNLAIVQIALTALLSAVAIPLAGEPLILPPAPVWLSVLFMGMIATAFCFAVMNWVQQSVSSTQATLVYALEPVWAGVFGYAVGEMLTPLGWFGCACILLGMVIGELRLWPRRSRLYKRVP
ncbi:membrane protein [Ktedonobacter sp. SOSP1-85]|uniref:DMT family transporter n=1 Tax=Ktedonobacter sp. SOSP1-85 TaxID=2778367 RepID=UPI001916AC1C|nr:DMT family transporter [Ktedonobacter sp. SOSP1-85]GHO81818.1 membrane protein [Ktedonobacter sp. SOSP1-85]